MLAQHDSKIHTPESKKPHMRSVDVSPYGELFLDWVAPDYGSSMVQPSIYRG
jgi:hypothetical protein